MQEAWIMRKFDAFTTIHLIAKSESDYDPQNLEKNIGLLLDTTEMYLAGSLGPRGDNTKIKRVKENERINNYLKTIYYLDSGKHSLSIMSWEFQFPLLLHIKIMFIVILRTNLIIKFCDCTNVIDDAVSVSDCLRSDYPYSDFHSIATIAIHEFEQCSHFHQ